MIPKPFGNPTRTTYLITQAGYGFFPAKSVQNENNCTKSQFTGLAEGKSGGVWKGSVGYIVQTDKEGKVVLVFHVRGPNDPASELGRENEIVSNF